MSIIPKKDFIKGLQDKGFEYSPSGRQPHEKLRLIVDGKKTGISVPISRGSKIKEYGSDLINLVKRELRLDTNKQVVDLIECPLSYDDYVNHLKDRGVRF
ncbi:MAG: type II toxin-antitoxin system HicA family toxin [Candidatus Omnitrophica bacterium]|nr:type II toxin-antitoxin system HicA family toxin [Candidatus Omnitrophota bacterium]